VSEGVCARGTPCACVNERALLRVRVCTHACGGTHLVLMGTTRSSMLTLSTSSWYRRCDDLSPSLRGISLPEEEGSCSWAQPSIISITISRLSDWSNENIQKDCSGSSRKLLILVNLTVSSTRKLLILVNLTVSSTNASESSRPNQIISRHSRRGKRECGNLCDNWEAHAGRSQTRLKAYSYRNSS